MKKAPKGIKFKRKGYYTGTNRDGVQREQDSPMDRGTGVVGALDKYGNPVVGDEMGQDEISTTQLDKSGNAKQPSANELKMRGAANTAGNALGGYGSGYYATNVGETKGENIRAGGMSAVSKMGGIGGAIGGLAAIGDQIGAPIKKRNEKVDNTGNVINEKGAKKNAIIGSLFSPSKALAYRSDSGNWGDVSGKQYLDYIEKPYKEQIEAEKKDAANSQLQEALAARERGEVGYTAQNTYKPHEFAKGGTIKGKGTGTSDSINAEVEEGSFVVPAKHADMAKMIKSALGMKKGKADLHQKKDAVPVKLSNGEELLTPDEKHEVKETLGEETLEKLAPEAEENVEGLVDGGEVGDDDFAKKELERLKSEKAKRDKLAKEKELSDKKLSQKFAEERSVSKNIEQKKKYQKAFEDDYKNKENKYKALKDSYETFIQQSESALKQPKRYGLPALVTPEGEIKKKENLLKLLGEAEVDYNKAKKIHIASKDDKNWNSDGTVKSGSLPKSPSFDSVNKTASAKINPASAKVFSTPSIKSGAELTGNNTAKPSSNKIWVDSLKPNLASTEAKDDMTTLVNPNANAIDTNPIQQAGIDKPFMDSIAKGKAEYAAENKPTNKPSFWDKVGSINTDGLGSTIANYGMAAYQIKKGKEGLKGERPVNTIDPTFLANVDTAQANAKFGYTPEQQFMLDQQNQNLLNADRFAARNFSGGSGGNAYNMERNASNNAFMRSLQNASANTELQQQKQGFAANLALQKAQMSRNIFEDSLNAFNAKQSSAGQLLGAGLSNVMDTNRFANYMKLRNQETQFKNQYDV